MKNLVALGVGGGKVINLAAYVRDPFRENSKYPEERWVKDVSQKELLHVLGDFEPDVQALLQVRFTSFIARVINNYVFVVYAISDKVGSAYRKAPTFLLAGARYFTRRRSKHPPRRQRRQLLQS